MLQYWTFNFGGKFGTGKYKRQLICRLFCTACVVSYVPYNPNFFLLLLLVIYDRQSSTILWIISLCVCPIRGNARRWQREGEAEVAEVEAEERGGGG